MKKRDVDALLAANPAAAEHTETIHKTINDLNSLRGFGIGGSGFNLVPPFGGPARSGRGVRGPARGRGLQRLKNTPNA